MLGCDDDILSHYEDKLRPELYLERVVYAILNHMGV